MHVVGYDFKATMCPPSACSFQPLGRPGDEASRAARDLVPCPLPFPECTLHNAAALKGKSRSVRSRIRHSASLREWANEGVTTINELASPANPSASAPSSTGQESLLEGIRSTYMSVPPPECTSPVAALEVLCGGRAGYEAVPSAPTRLRRTSTVSLPPPGLTFAKGESLLRGEDLQAWVHWQRELLRSPSELEQVLRETPPVQPHTDPLFTSEPKQYAKFLRSLYDRGLILFGRRRRATVGVFPSRRRMGPPADCRHPLR